MPPPLALLLCTVFVLFLLRLERKQGPEMSRALWIPTIWMLSIASKPLGVWFPSAGGDMESGSPLDRVFLSGLLCLGLFILACRKFSWSRAIKEHTWLTLLIGYMLISILWSDIPFISFKRWIRELVAVVMAFLVLTERDPRQALESLIRRTVYMLIPFSLLLIKYFGEYGRMYNRWSGQVMWVGVTLHKNSLGRLCLIAAFFLVWALVRRWQGRDTAVGKYQTSADLFVLILTLWLFRGPTGGVQSATSTAALAVGLASFAGLFWMKKHKIIWGANTWAAIMALVIGFGIVTPMVGGSSVAGFASFLGRDETLTGRTDIWAGILPIAMQHSILGCGFGGFWTTMKMEAFKTNTAHSGYLEIILELGFVGILLISMFVLSCCRKAHRELGRDFDWGALWICYLLMTVLHNVAESSLDSFTSQLTAILLFLAVCSTAVTSYTPGVSRQV